MKVASIDFGSNTTLLLICDVEEGSVVSVDCDETRITKMGQGVHQNKRFDPEALSRVKAALFDYKKLIDKFQPKHIFAVATSAARDVENSDELFAIAESFGISIDIISGNREAELTYIGAFCGRAEPPNTCVIDIGGGSTEVICRQGGKVVGESVDVGSVRLMDLFGDTDPMPKEKLAEMRAYIRSKMNPTWKTWGLKNGIGVAGTPTIMACMEDGFEFDKSRLDGMKLQRSRINDWVERLQPMTLKERENIPGLPAKRADVILAGAAILLETMLHLDLDEIEVSTYGVRYGVALAYSQKNTD